MKLKTLLAILLFLITGQTFAQTFTLKSNDVGGQATMKQVLNGGNCTGSNLSPQLSWENPPKETESFAITMFDEDAPSGSGWWHWLIFDIPKNSRELKTGAGDVLKNIAPQGSVQSITDFGNGGYGGPCPPEGHGIHKYTITIFALKKDKLGLDKNANPPLVGYYINNNVIEKASIIMYYKRDK